MKSPVTTAQLEYIKTLMLRCEFDMRICNLFHTRIAEEARIDSPRPKPGEHVDTWLATLTKDGAGRLIRIMRERAS